jgi:hypothetical protein
VQILRALRSFQFLRLPPTSFAALLGVAAIFALPLLLLGLFGLSSAGTARAADDFGVSISATTPAQATLMVAVPITTAAQDVQSNVAIGDGTGDFAGQATALQVDEPQTVLEALNLVDDNGISGQTAVGLRDDGGLWTPFGAIGLALALLGIAALASLIVASVSARAGPPSAFAGAGDVMVNPNSQTARTGVVKKPF